MKKIDLRSDTVTRPTEEMRDAMRNAEVGDDVYGDDPTVIKLERLAAEMLGKEAALFVPSGTMGNQLAVMTHTRRADTIIVGRHSHIVVHEGGGAAALSGVNYHIIDAEDAIIRASDVKKGFNFDNEDDHLSDTGLVCIENALAVGKVVDIKIQQELYDYCKKIGVPVHMDGARLFNAATYLGVDAKELASNCDSVMTCLSKGLAAPIGSMLAGDTVFIKRARKNRKMLGGGMRQAGFLASAGIIALEKMTKRLNVDHENAKHMANRLAKMDNVTIDLDSVQINMVFFKLANDKGLLKFLEGKNIVINGPESGEYRFVSHNDVTREDIDYALDLMQGFVKN